MTADTRSSVRGQTAVVTGAGNGLGRAIAHELGRQGARVVLVGRNAAKLEQVLTELGPGHLAAPCDTSAPEAVDELARGLADEEVSIVVNNAGIAGPVAPLTDIDVVDWDEVFAVNVRGVFLMARAFLPPMISRGHGHILNMASVSGKRPLANRTPYTASKMAVIGLTATLAHEVGAHGVAVNSLSPGPVAGPRMARNFRLEAARTGVDVGQAEAAFVSRAAFGRMVTEHEVAIAAVNILNTPGMTGADIDLSAGMVAR